MIRLRFYALSLNRFEFMHERILTWNQENGWIEERPATVIETIKK